MNQQELEFFFKFGHRIFSQRTYVSDDVFFRHIIILVFITETQTGQYQEKISQMPPNA